MIRLRNSKGETTELEPGTFIEVTDMDGKVALAIFQAGPNRTHLIEPGTKDAARYSKLFNAPFCKTKVINLPA